MVTERSAGQVGGSLHFPVETDDGRLIDDDPKSHAGRRRVAFPKEIAPELHWHLERFAQQGDDGLVFIGPKGGRLRRSTFRRTWTKARTAVGLPDLHFHDLRHTGNTMAAGQGASLRELMERMGHSSAGPHSSTSTPPRSETRPSRRHGQAATPGAVQGQDCGGGSGHGVTIGARNGHAAGSAPLRDHSETGDHALDLGRNGESGRRERAKGIEPS
jgi:hypothetical protein